MSINHDAAELPQASMLDHPADHFLEAVCARCHHAVDAVCPDCGGNVDASGAGSDGTETPPFSRAEFHRRLMLLLTSAKLLKFTLGCYLLTTGSGFSDGVSMKEFGRAWGVPKAKVLGECRSICAYLGIAPSSDMRKEKVAEAAEKCSPAEAP